MENAMKIRTTLLQRDCTRHCRSIMHGNMITAAITKRSSTDQELGSYLNFLCCNCESVKDSVGRTALHVAASCGRISLIRWLVSVRNADINIRDEESGYTALHRALYYGNIHAAVELIKLGAETSIMDMNSMTAFEHVMEDGGTPWELYGQVFTWGLNKNNSLGPFGARTFPEYLDSFHRRFPNVSIHQVCLGKFHSVFVDTVGGAYSCGHGLGGRLGLGSEMSVVEPVKIPFADPEKTYIVNACIGRDHSVFLGVDQMLYTVGSNKYRVLGVYPPPEKTTSPRTVKCQIKPIFGILAGSYHSAAWNSYSLYVWGLNVGQFGNMDQQIITPKPVRLFGLENTFIKKAACSDGAIGVVLGKGDIFILHEYRCRKIASKFHNAADLSLIGGKLNTSLDVELKNDPVYELRVLIRTHSGHLYLWQESDPYLCRLIFSIPKEIHVKKAFINAIEISFVNNLGAAYKGTIKPRKRKETNEIKGKVNLQSYLCKQDLVTIDIRKISRIQRGIAIVSDPKGDDYCVIQQEPYANSFDFHLPENEMQSQLKTFFEETNEEDGLHDIKIKVQNTIFPAHKFILARESKVLKELFRESKDEIVLTDITADIFREMLSFIYTGTSELLDIGERMDEYQTYCTSGKNANIWDIKNGKFLRNSLRRLLEAAKLYGCHNLMELLSDVDLLDTHLINKKCPSIDDSLINFDMKSLPEYYDIVLECNDGVKLNAHKCILAARMDYFRSMFAARWSTKTSSIEFPHPSNIAEAILKFAYTDSASFLNLKDCDFLMRLLIASDEYLVLSLKKHCENYLLKNLDLKNAAEIFNIAVCYRADKLREGVINFIVCNIAYFLEIRALEELNDEILKELTQCYINQRLASGSRIITPDSTAVSDETIDEIKNTYTADADEMVVSKMIKSAPMNIKRKGPVPRRTVEIKERRDVELEGTSCNDACLFREKPVYPEPDNYEGIKARLSAITRAAAIVEIESFSSDYTSLHERETVSSLSNDFPVLGSPPRNNLNWHGRTFNRQENKHKMTRLSQKERKRLSSESKESSQVPESPKNPWKVILPPSPIVSPSTETAFCDILLSERKQKGNLVKLTNKLLMHTQMEDKAIADLEKFYNVSNVEDEIIMVQRVDIGKIACPVWVSKKQGHS